jgi:site-specific DNA-cytosine methylase
MARLGLGPRWRCIFANDIDNKKAACYRSNFPSAELTVANIATLEPSDLPGIADLHGLPFLVRTYHWRVTARVWPAIVPELSGNSGD